MIASNEKQTGDFQPATYQLRWLMLGLLFILGVTFFPYIFGGKIFLTSDMVDTMMVPFNAEYGPPQAENHYPYDGMAQTYPYKTETKEALEKGRLSYWNPHILAGYPEYAETMANNYDPLNIFLIWFNQIDVIHIETIVELFLAGLGMLLLLRFFGVNPHVNLLFAGAYMLNSLFITSAMHRWIIASFCWVPFVIFMILRYFHSNKKENILFAACFLALSFLGGNFQTSFFAVFVAAITIFLYPSKNTERSFLGRAGVLIILGCIAFGLSAFMWLPTLELLFQTLLYGGHLYSTTVHGSYSLLGRFLSIPLLSSFFFPGLAGDPQSFSLKNVIGIDIVNFNGAISFLPALFGFWGCFAFWKRMKALRPFIVITAAGLLLTIATPLYDIFYYRIFIIVAFSLCVVGAVTFQSYLDSDVVKNLFARFFTWVKVLFGILTAGLAAGCAYIAINTQTLFPKFIEYVKPRIVESGFGTGNDSWMLGRVGKTLHYYSFSSLSLWTPLLCALIIIVALGYYKKSKLQKQMFLAIVLVATVAQLFIFARTWFPSLDTKQFPIYPKNPIMSFLQKDSTGARYDAWRNFAKDPYMMPQNCSNVYKTYEIQGFETMTPRTIHVLYKEHIDPDSLDLRLLGLANVKYIVVGKRTYIPPNLVQVYRADSVVIYENLLCKPRAYFAYQTDVVESDSEAGKALLRPDFDGSHALFIRRNAPPDLVSYQEGNHSIHIDRSENDEMDITAESDTKGIFILSDTYYPGWKCYVNGKEQPIYRVNYCMRGVILDAGKSNLSFRFEPDIFKAGSYISLLAAICSLGCIGFFKFKK